jgi:hypothetical protein
MDSHIHEEENIIPQIKFFGSLFGFGCWKEGRAKSDRRGVS